MKLLLGLCTQQESLSTFYQYKINKDNNNNNNTLYNEDAYLTIVNLP